MNTLTRMFGGVLFVALGLAALVNATAWWVSVAFSFVLTLLFVAVAGALCRTGTRRAFWSGFAVFGLGYLAPATAIVSESAGGYLVTTELLRYLYPSVRRSQPPSVESGIVVWFRSDGTVSFDGKPVALEQLEATILKRLPEQPPDPRIPFRMGMAPEPYLPLAVFHDPEVDRELAQSMVDLTNSYRNIGLSNFTQTASIPSSSDFVRLGHCLFTLLFACVGGWVARYFYVTRDRAS